MKIESISQLGLDFFGLNSKNVDVVRANLFTQIHEICFHGKGGYDWETVYNMPRWLRQFTFSKINDFYRKEAEQIENLNSKSNKSKSILMESSGEINHQAWSELSKSKKVKY